MKKKIQLLPSGISLVDSAWGGFYRGGTYMLIGAHKTGRTLLGLQFALESAKQKEVCLYFTNMRPKDLMIQAASIDFDLYCYATIHDPDRNHSGKLPGKTHCRLTEPGQPDQRGRLQVQNHGDTSYP